MSGESVYIWASRVFLSIGNRLEDVKAIAREVSVSKLIGRALTMTRAIISSQLALRKLIRR